jgi:hypothetical protein
MKALIKAMPILLQKVNNESPMACLTVKDAPAIFWSLNIKNLDPLFHAMDFL